MRKKFLAVVLAAALACNTTGVSAAAQPAVAGMSVLKGLFGGDRADEGDTQSDVQKNKRRSQVYGAESTPKADSVVLDIGRGDIRISGKEISAYDTEGNQVTKTCSKYVVTGSTQEHSIEIADGANANIVLSNVDISRTEKGESPIWIADDSDGDVSVTLEGVNTLQAGEGAAAIQKNDTTNKSAYKSGQLKITCGNTSPSHVCDAACGTLVASGGAGAAAIGGASGMGTSKIDIAGGTITAAGGIGGGAGGVGTKMEITGGVVDAGTINGKENGKDNVMNGNALLFADSMTGMNLKKGVLYQNGEGTVYGDVETSQMMMAHIAQADGTLDIPAEKGATLTVDGATDVSNVNFTEGSEVKVDTSKTPAETPVGGATQAPTEEPTSVPEVTEEATPEPTQEATATPEVTEEATATPEPTKEVTAAPARRSAPRAKAVVEEEEQEQVRAGDDVSGNTSGNTATPTPTPANHYDSSTIAHVQRGGTEVGSGTHLKYGEKLTVEASIGFIGGAENPGVTPPGAGDSNRVRCYLQPVNGSTNRILIGEEALEREPYSGYNAKVVVSVTIENEMITPGLQYNFTAEYTGTNLFPKSTSTPINYIIDKGTLSPETDTKYIDAIAGQTIGETINLKDLDKPKNAAGVSLNGDWHWVDDNNNVIDDTVNKEVLYPSATDAQYEYTARFTIDPNTENDKYNRPSELTVRFRVSAALVAQTPVVESDPVKTTVTGYDNKQWYNAEHKTIKIKVDGYQIFKSTTPPSTVSGPDGWETQANWLSEFEFKDDFHTGDYTLYVKRINGGDIGSVVVKDFNVDRTYPVIDSVDQSITGETASFQFSAVSENNPSQGSGIYRFKLGSRARLNGTALTSELTESDVERSTLENSTGYFNIPNLNPQTWYDVGLIVEDNAKNKTKYFYRVFNTSNSPVPDQATLDNQGKLTPSGNQINEYYGYVFQTDKQDMKGTVTLEARNQEGMIKSQVGAGDTITATVNPTVIDYGSLQYSWWRRPSGGGSETRIAGAMNQPTYPVATDDIGYTIICRVRGTNTSELGTIQGEIGPVVRAMWPEEYWPKDGVEDLENRTFTFTGNSNVVYEYSINGGDWQTIERTGFDKLVIELGDVTVLEGNLKVRAKETSEYLASDPPLTNKQSFISTGELEITLEGDNYYGGILTATINSQAINSSLFSYQWSCDDGRTFDNAGNSYQVQKEDINKHIIVKVSIQGYEGADNTVTSQLIGKRPVDAVVNVTPKQYDGTTTAEAEVALNGLINGDEVTASARVEFENKNAGEDKSVRLTNRQEGGSQIGCYDVKWPNSSDVKGTILPRTLDLSMKASDKVYDGTTDAVVSFEAEPLPGDSVEVSGTGQFADKNAGTNKRVTPKDVQVTGRDADNYTGTGSTASTTANITPKDIQIEGITVQDKTYDGTTDAVIAATFKGAVDDISYTYTAAFDTPNVGKDKRVTAAITLAGESATNYNLSNGTATGTGNIVRALAPYDEADMPQGLTGIEGKKLSSVYIGRGFTWKEPDTVMKTVGRHTYPAYYNPDASQYGDREIELEVLVQCAKHTWGDWTITVEPTKEEMGERQRICGVCGYIETEVIARAPYIANEDTKVGWNDIIQAINNASSGTEIPVVMNGTETLPASVLDVLQGREVSIVLQMGDGITWTIRGEDITASTLKDINMAVTLYTDNIPSDVLDPYVVDKTAIQVHLAYSGEFGFVATLRVPLGDEYAGIDSTLYYYNPTRERLEQMDSNKITEDGIGRYDFTHASDYAVIIDKRSDVQGGDTPSSNDLPGATGTVTPGAQATGGAAGGNTGAAATGQATATGTAARATSGNVTIISSNGAKTEDDTPIVVYIALLLAGAGGIGAAGVYRRKRQTRN